MNGKNTLFVQVEPDRFVFESLEARRLLTVAMGEPCILPAIDPGFGGIVMDWPAPIDMKWDDSRAIIASAGTQIDGVLASFNGTLPQDQYSATIDWGDGVTSDGVIQRQEDGSFVVVASHDYAAKGDFEVSVNVTATDGSVGYDFHRVLTQAEGLTLTTEPSVWVYLSDTQEQAYIASFYDLNPSDESAYSVLIDWGDGTTSVGSVARAWDGTYDVMGNHAYAAAGDYTVSFTVIKQTDSGSTATLTASGPATVEEPWDLGDPIDYGDPIDTGDPIDYGDPELGGVIYMSMVGRPMEAEAFKGAVSVTNVVDQGAPKQELTGIAPQASAPLANVTAPKVISIASDVFQSGRKIKELDSPVADPLA